jgi:hypothetical protein
MFSFGGSINASRNSVAGVSVNSNAGLDLDAASTLNSSDNGDGIRIQQGSVVTVFNTPQFSGSPGFSTITARNNTGRWDRGTIRADDSVRMSGLALEPERAAS